MSTEANVGYRQKSVNGRVNWRRESGNQTKINSKEPTALLNSVWSSTKYMVSDAYLFVQVFNPYHESPGYIAAQSPSPQ